MLKNYFTIAFRNLIRQRSYTVINLFGLTLGITCSIVLFQLSRYFLSFDRYHEKGERIYRIVSTSDGATGADHTPGVPQPFPDAFRTDFTEIENSTFISYQEGGLVSVEVHEQLKYFEEQEGIAYVDDQFLKIFTRPLLRGNVDGALDEPGEAVISERWAVKYFGEQDPLGKSLKLDKNKELVITGIAEDPPDNTDFPFDLMVAYATVKDELLKKGWGSVTSNDQFYLLLHPGQTPNGIEANFPAFVKKYFDDPTDNLACKLQPLYEIHFDSRYDVYSYLSVDKTTIYALWVVAAFLVIAACINFVNLSTAIAVNRSREVGIRKVLGSDRKQLIFQFLGEACVLTTFAALSSLGAAELLMLRIHDFIGVDASIDLVYDHIFLTFFFLILFAVSLLSGLYPAFILSGFRPVEALKKRAHTQKAGFYFSRRGLVITQFVISQVFIISTLVLIKQMNYFLEKDLGFDREALVTVPLPGEEGPQKKKILRRELGQIPGVNRVSLAFTSPLSGSVAITNYQLEEGPDDFLAHVKYVDSNYLNTYGLHLVAGVNLDERDTVHQLLINEKLAAMHGQSPDEMLGKMVEISGREVPVVGVVRDFHTLSLEYPIEPTILLNNLRRYQLATLKVTLPEFDQLIKAVETRWKYHYPEYTFSFNFVEGEVAEFYEEEESFIRIFTAFTLVVIFIGCLGLYGLVAFMTHQKVKEIGIRKVLGASIANLVGLFSKEFMRLVSLAFLVAAPLAWYFMDSWLRGFQYRIDLDWPVFLVAMIASLAIAFSTIGYRALKAARGNPADALRNE